MCKDKYASIFSREVKAISDIFSDTCSFEIGEQHLHIPQFCLRNMQSFDGL